MFLWTRGCIFDSDKKPTFFCSVSKNDGKKSFLSKLIFLKLSFWTSRWLFWQNSRRTALSFLFTLRKCYIIFLRKIIFLLKMLFCTRKRQFWRTRRKISRKSRNFSSNARKWRSFFSKKRFPSKRSYGHVDCSLDNPADFYWQKRRQFSAPAARLKKKVCFSEEKWVSSKSSAGDVECSFEYPAEKFLTKEQKIFAPYLTV